MDQCKNCTSRGDIEICLQTPCTHRETWGFRAAVEMAYMAAMVEHVGAAVSTGMVHAQEYFERTHCVNTVVDPPKMRMLPDGIRYPVGGLVERADRMAKARKELK